MERIVTIVERFAKRSQCPGNDGARTMGGLGVGWLVSQEDSSRAFAKLGCRAKSP
jgi:hypothetical protein